VHSLALHDDPAAHVVEQELLRKLHQSCVASGAMEGRRLAVSLEFFERDVQSAMDEYLNGLCRESDLLTDARPWPNYARDYRPIVEYCKANSLQVVCANALRRHVSLAGRQGAESLLQLPGSSKAFLPPLPFPPASEMYADKFRFTMLSMQEPQIPAPPAAKAEAPGTEASELPGPKGSAADRAHRQEPHGIVQSSGQPAGECPYIGLGKAATHMLDAQCLWDASMADSILTALRHPWKAGAGTGEKDRSASSPLVLHICGKFHCDHHLGIPERLRAMSIIQDGRNEQEAAEGPSPRGAGASSAQPVRTLVVSINPAAPEHLARDSLVEGAHCMADFVVLTDSSLPRSFELLHPV